MRIEPSRISDVAMAVRVEKLAVAFLELRREGIREPSAQEIFSRSGLSDFAPELETAEENDEYDDYWFDLPVIVPIPARIRNSKGSETRKSYDARQSALREGYAAFHAKTKRRVSDAIRRSVV